MKKNTARIAIAALLMSPGVAQAAARVPAWVPECPSPCMAPSPRAWPQIAYDASTRQVVLHGGWGAQGFQTDTWTWDGSGWTKHSPSVSPGGGAYGAMAYDPMSRTSVLFNAFGETWTWDGGTSTWTKQTPPVSPQWRVWASMAYDPASQTVLLFGGSPDYVSTLGDTWAWDGTTKTWTQQSPPVSPPARHSGGAVTDQATGSVVLFGGYGGEGVWELNDTWTWNGASGTWTHRDPPASPSPRFSSAMAGTPEGALLFGGQYQPSGNVVVLGDTWAWDGALGTWTPEPAAGPEPRAHAVMAFDAARGRAVMFGGLGFPHPCTSQIPCLDGNWLGDTWTFGLGTTGEPEPDTTPPETTITSGPSGAVSSAEATFEFTSSESGSTFECRLDGAAFSACSSPKTYTGLAEGSHTFEVRATDASGNTDETPAARAWTVDTTPPDTTITSGPSGTVSSTNATFGFGSTEAGASFACRLDGGGFASCVSPKTYGGLADGTHTFTVAASDAASNTDPTPASRTWTVDATAPVAPTLLSPADGSIATNAKPTFDWSDVADPSGVTYRIQIDNSGNGFPSPEVDRSGLFTSQFTPTKPLAKATYSWRVRGADGAGNVGPWSAVFTVTVSSGKKK